MASDTVTETLPVDENAVNETNSNDPKQKFHIKLSSTSSSKNAFGAFFKMKKGGSSPSESDAFAIGVRTIKAAKRSGVPKTVRIGNRRIRVKKSA